jgi:Tfp pilus assembly protein PilN
MLKINLLPVRQLQKIAYSRRQFFGLFGFLLLTILLLLAAGYIQNQRIASANTK